MSKFRIAITLSVFVIALLLVRAFVAWIDTGERDSCINHQTGIWQTIQHRLEFGRLKASCLDSGNEWLLETTGCGVFAHCVIYAKDAGKPCRDSDECQFYCLAPCNFLPGRPCHKNAPEIKGTCSKNSDQAYNCLFTIGDNIGKKENLNGSCRLN